MEICSSSNKLIVLKIVHKLGKEKIFFPKCSLKVIIKDRVEEALEETQLVKAE